jgi:thiol:disulfide interchange protein
MKKLILLALLATPTLTTQIEAAPAKKKTKVAAQWRPSYAAALAEAKKTGKPIFVDFFTTWCGPCKYLDAVTYKDPKFVAASKNWILVKVDAEKNAANIKLAEKYRVEGYPTILFLKPNGKEVGRSVGIDPAKPLVAEMKKVAVKAAGGKSI